MAHKHKVYDSDTHFSINPIARTLLNEGSPKSGLIQYDHNSERFTFELPRIVEGHDMSLCNVIQIHYTNIDSKTKEQKVGIYEVDDMQISPDDEDVVIFSWLISQNATQYVGNLSFLIRFVCSDEGGEVGYVWNTSVYDKISVGAGMLHNDAVVEQYADFMEQWRANMAADLPLHYNYIVTLNVAFEELFKQGETKDQPYANSFAVEAFSRTAKVGDIFSLIFIDKNKNNVYSFAEITSDPVQNNKGKWFSPFKIVYAVMLHNTEEIAELKETVDSIKTEDWTFLVEVTNKDGSVTTTPTTKKVCVK